MGPGGSATRAQIGSQRVCPSPTGRLSRKRECPSEPASRGLECGTRPTTQFGLPPCFTTLFRGCKATSVSHRVSIGFDDGCVTAAEQGGETRPGRFAAWPPLGWHAVEEGMNARAEAGSAHRRSSHPSFPCDPPGSHCAGGARSRLRSPRDDKPNSSVKWANCWAHLSFAREPMRPDGAGSARKHWSRRCSSI